MDRRRRALEIIGQVTRTKIAKLESETHLFLDLGIDSAQALHLLMELETGLQIEINRSLYMDEDSFERRPYFDTLGEHMSELVAALARLDGEALAP